MKITVEKNCCRIDKVTLSCRQHVYLNKAAVMKDLTKIVGVTNKDDLLTISRGNLSAVIYKNKKGKLWIEHSFHENGNRSARWLFGLPLMLDKDIGVKWDNFIPVDYRDKINIFDFMTKDFADFLSEKLETDFEDMVSNLGGTLSKHFGGSVVPPNAYLYSFSMKYVEVCVDVLVPNNFNLLGDYHFLDNLSGVADWFYPNKPDEPEIRGTLYKTGIDFSIYTKDTSHPRFNQIRFELKFDKDHIRAVLGRNSFSTTKQKINKKNKKKKTATLGQLFKRLLEKHALQFASICILNKATLSMIDRNKHLKTILIEKLKTKDGYTLGSEWISAIHKELIDNHLVIKKSALPNHIQATIVNSGLFKRIDSGKGRYQFKSELLERVL